jgi:hypothetical protein
LESAITHLARGSQLDRHYQRVIDFDTLIQAAGLKAA